MKYLNATNCIASVALAFGMLEFATTTKANTVYDLAADWSTSGNGSGVWTYGQYTEGVVPTSFTPFAINATGPSGGVDNLSTLNAWGVNASDPNIIKNLGQTFTTTQFGQITFNSDAVTFGPYLGPTVARFTAPSAGYYDLSATFQTVQVANSDPTAYIAVNGVIDYSGTVSSTATTNKLGVELTAGETLDVIVWGDNANNKTTQVAETITVPDGGITAGLLGVALIGMQALRRKLVL